MRHVLVDQSRSASAPNVHHRVDFGYQVFVVQPRASVAKFIPRIEVLDVSERVKEQGRLSSIVELGVSGFLPVVPVFDEFGLTAFLLIQAFAERHNPLFRL